MRALLFTLGLGLLAACGAPPSSLDNCKATCEAQRKCGILSDAAAQNCNNDCDAQKGTFADQDAQCEKFCKNCADIRMKYNSCAKEECNKIGPCAAAVDPTCIAK
jgi:hypothetical protein